MEILRLQPVGKDHLWGGTRLREEYGKKINLTPLAETWECSVHPDGPSVVANGEFKGKTLADVLKVHPNDAYARVHENQNGKTEMWYVLDAEEGASLIYSFQHKVTAEILRKAVEVMNMDVAPDVRQKPRMIKYYPGCSREMLCRCKYFETERVQVTKGFSFSVLDSSFQVVMCLSGYGEIETSDAEIKPMRFQKCETMFLPAWMGRCRILGETEVHKVRC